MANQAKKREARKIVYTKPKERIADREKGWTPTTFEVPNGMQTFKFRKEKTYRLTIVPFVAGKGNPSADEGQVHYERTYYTHPKIGPEEETHTCRLKTFGEPCPVCQQVSVLRRQGELNDETEQSLRPKERQLWLLIDHDERDKGVQIMECAHYGKGAGFGEMLDNKLDAADEDSPYQSFFHLGTDGMTLVVKTRKDSFNGKEFYKPVNMELEPRREKDSVPEKLLDEVPCLDDLVINPDYQELHDKFHGEEATETAPKPKDKKTNDVPKDNAVEEEETEDNAVEEEETETESEEAELEVGSIVEFMYKGEQVQGEVKKIDEDAGKAAVKVEGNAKLLLVAFDDLSLVAAEGDDGGDEDRTDDDDSTDEDGGDGDTDADEESEGKEEDESGDEEDDQETEEEPAEDEDGDVDEDPDLSDDEEIPFDAEDEDEVDDEEPAQKPAPKKPAPKAPAKPAAKPAPKKAVKK